MSYNPNKQPHKLTLTLKGDSMQHLIDALETLLETIKEGDHMEHGHFTTLHATGTYSLKEETK